MADADLSKKDSDSSFLPIVVPYGTGDIRGSVSKARLADDVLSLTWVMTFDDIPG